MKSIQNSRLVTVGVVTSVLVLGVTACSKPSNAEVSKDAASVHPQLFQELPKTIQDSGHLKMAVLADYPPATYTGADGKLIGYEIELGRALGKQLGVQVDFQAAAFSTVLTGVQAGRYDTALSSMADLPTREKSATFVNYLKSGVAMLVPRGNPKNVTNVMSSFCGLTVSATRGTLQIQLMQDYSKSNCGARPIQIPLLDSPSEAILQVQTHRADAYMADAVVAQYLADQSAKNKGSQLDVVQLPGVDLPPAGMPVRPDDKELQAALTKAWDNLIADGTYKAILVKWHVEALSIDKATVNAGSK